MPETGGYQKPYKFAVTLVKLWQILVGCQGLVELDPILYRDQNIIGDVTARQLAALGQLFGRWTR